MLLSVTEAATLLGKSPRAVRAALARGELPGRKQGGRWVVPREGLPLSEAQHRALQARADEIRAVVEDALPSRGATRRGDRRRSLADLEVFRAACEVTRQVQARDDAPLQARDELERGLLALAEGWYQYESGARLDALTRARAAFSRAAAQLLLAAPWPPSAAELEPLARLETEVFPALAGLFRRAERAAQRGAR